MTITSVLVIGAGAMGGGIAAHCANAGLDVMLLDVPAHADDRNATVKSLWERQLKARPAALFSAKTAEHVRLGNIEDDFAAGAAQADWIIEAIVEQLEPKRALHTRIDAARKPGAIVSSNTSGIPINAIAAGRSAAFQAHFLGAHFFNPPRYLKLLEIIPSPRTDAAVLRAMIDLAENRLGKSVVVCKDTPNFIANRIGAFAIQTRMSTAIAQGYGVEEVDVLSGPLTGNPRTGTFRLADLIGLDVLAQVYNTLYELALNDESRECFKLPAVMQSLITQKSLGNKSGAGFYKTVQGAGGKEFWALDLTSGVYVPASNPSFDSVASTRALPLPERWRAIFDADSSERGARFVVDTTLNILAYAARRVPEISDSPADIDRAICLGFGSEMGPFQIWDAIGVAHGIALMKARAIAVAPWVETMLAAGRASFYTRSGDAAPEVYQPTVPSSAPAAVGRAPSPIVLAELAGSPREVARNASASLFDIGDGVLCYELHGKGNTLDLHVADMGTHALELLQSDRWRGMVIGNQGKDFCLGANIGIFQAAFGDPAQLDATLSRFQTWIQDLRHSPKPIVAAVRQRALGGGAEMCLLAARIVASAETYMGLVEFGVGVIPAFGGCKELLRRNVSPHITSSSVNALPYLQDVFETIVFAKVSESAEQARDNGFLAHHDPILLSDEQLLGAAKRSVLNLADAGHPALRREAKPIYAIGSKGKAALATSIDALRWSGRISEYDATIARALSHVLCGGDLSAPQWVSEQHILDLERAAFVDLAQRPQTQDRIAHMLNHGKPLRN